MSNHPCFASDNPQVIFQQGWSFFASTLKRFVSIGYDYFLWVTLSLLFFCVQFYRGKILTDFVTLYYMLLCVHLCFFSCRYFSSYYVGSGISRFPRGDDEILTPSLEILSVICFVVFFVIFYTAIFFPIYCIFSKILGYHLGIFYFSFQKNILGWLICFSSFFIIGLMYSLINAISLRIFWGILIGLAVISYRFLPFVLLRRAFLMLVLNNSFYSICWGLFLVLCFCFVGIYKVAQRNYHLYAYGNQLNFVKNAFVLCGISISTLTIFLTFR